MSRSFPINCTVNQQRPNRIAKVGLDDHRMPVLFLWCKRCRTEHRCSITQLLQSWRGMAEGNKQDLLTLQGVLQGVLVKIQADLEDMEVVAEQQEETAG